MKWIAYLLILTGIITMCYPKLKNYYYTNKENHLLQSWDHPPTKQAVSSYKKLGPVLTATKKETKPARKDPLPNSLLGTLEIKRIHLRLPILEGASLSNMKIAAGHISGTTPIGEEGNAAIAAHRSYTYGKQFNRLTEVKTGDLITIETKKEKLIYRMIAKKIVKPADLSVLHSSKNENIITLITCHPFKHPTHRYIVKAKLIEERLLTSKGSR
ncbi:class D sortase [Fictibacillus sp. WQ 8-8]|uniref:class D sortase n=1 Tax=Fictibacillus sp. WQ 8-8 TaxID=2938788 RepID=UPI00210BEE20|nr:class D sortase [Fictibacillus sp. WQ 8-8]MCQ6268031.1 class D sortase [Fictibacillus sp. WQ 8-8]